MIRLTLLWLYVGGLGLYAWRNWYRALCGLILVTAVLEHPDMPKSLFGIQGLNPWNLLLADVVMAWAATRRRERWDMPGHASLALILYVTGIVVGFVRLMADPSYLGGGAAQLVSEYFVNSLKWIVPALLLFDGCRGRRRLLEGLASVLGLYVLLALQIVKWVPPWYVLEAARLEQRSHKILEIEVGYHQIDLAMMMAGACWALVAARRLFKRALHQALALGLALTTVYALALTSGRGGYVTWAVVGLLLGIARWRAYLLLAPAAALLVALFVPGAAERVLQGFSFDEPLVGEEADIELDQVTSGRTLIWTHVIPRIAEAPVFGHGREAMRRTGLSEFLGEHGERVGHPHNAYLELLLDAGCVGVVLVMPVYLVGLRHGFRLLRSRNALCEATGGVGVSLILALLVASLTGQTLYPRESVVGMWSAMGLLLRVAVEHARATRRAMAGAVASPNLPEASQARSPSPRDGP